MDESAQELIDKTEKLAVNPKNPVYSTNWCDIPMEMQFECIKRMDFRTRTRLGATSHTEKSLVEAKKYKYDSVTLAYCNCSAREVLTIDAMMNNSPFGYVRFQTIDDHEKMRHFVVQLLKNCEIDSFEFCEQDEPSDLLNFWPEIEKCAPFRFQTFKSRSSDPKGALFFLKNCERVENILLNNKDNRNYEISEFMDLLAVINGKLVHFKHLFQSDRGVHQLVQKWIDNHSEIRKSLQIVTKFAGFVDSFASEFEDRVIYKKDDEIRIRTDEESKHILMRCEKGDRSQFVDSYYSCTVIPSNLLESEYEKDDQWIKQTRYEELCEDDKYHYVESEDEYSDYDGYDYYGGDLPPNPWWEEDNWEYNFRT